MGRAAACDCGIPWTFLLTFLDLDMLDILTNGRRFPSPLIEDLNYQELVLNYNFIY